jgi:hypothetical protein
VAEGARRAVIVARHGTAVLLVVILIACAPTRRSSAETKQTSPVTTTANIVPLTFSKPWLRGTVSYDGPTARNVSKTLPLTISLEITDARQASRQLRATAFDDTCLRVRVLYRPGSSEPAKTLGAAQPHSTSMWAPWPIVCVYAGVRWTWRVNLLSDEMPTADGKNVVMLTSGASRARGEQIAIALVRPPRGGAEVVVAQSGWVSLAQAAGAGRQSRRR